MNFAKLKKPLLINIKILIYLTDLMPILEQKSRVGYLKLGNTHKALFEKGKNKKKTKPCPSNKHFYSNNRLG